MALTKQNDVNYIESMTTTDHYQQELVNFLIKSITKRLVRERKDREIFAYDEAMELLNKKR